MNKKTTVSQAESLNCIGMPIEQECMSEANKQSHLANVQARVRAPHTALNLLEQASVGEFS